MLCPICDIQMFQKGKQGAGVSRDDYYETWTIQICPTCGREVKEFYSAKVLKKGKFTEMGIDK